MRAFFNKYWILLPALMMTMIVGCNELEDILGGLGGNKDDGGDKKDSCCKGTVGIILHDTLNGQIVTFDAMIEIMGEDGTMHNVDSGHQPIFRMELCEGVYKMRITIMHPERKVIEKKVVVECKGHTWVKTLELEDKHDGECCDGTLTIKAKQDLKILFHGKGMQKEIAIAAGESFTIGSLCLGVDYYISVLNANHNERIIYTQSDCNANDVIEL